jgi:hypothetical protein
MAMDCMINPVSAPQPIAAEAVEGDGFSGVLMWMW